MKKQILSLLVGLIGALIPQICPALPSLPEDMVITHIMRHPFLEDRITMSFIHPHDNKVIGEAALWRAYYQNEPKGYYLALLEIEPCYQNKGYGQRLFKLMSMYAKQQGGYVLHWKAYPFRTSKPSEALPRLIKFYENLGGEVRTLSEDTADMRLVLKIKRYGPLDTLND